MIAFYWSRTGSELAALLWLVLAGLWGLGGWALATHAFRLARAERLLIGFGIGLGCWLWGTNLLAHFLEPGLSFSLAAGGTALAGLAFAWRRRRPLLDWRDLQVWPLLLVGVGLGWVFLRISQGLAIFDDYVHLPLISTMAAGNLPPRYFVNADVPFAYHYGFHLLGASLMRIAGLHPWSAFDLSKAILWAYALLLAYLVGRRYTRRPAGGVLASALLAFAAGTRYLLLLLPEAFLEGLDPLVAFGGAEQGMGASFSQSLVQGWSIDGGPPSPYIFGFLSGIARPLVMAHAGLTILNVVLLLLLWLILFRASRRASFLILAALLAFWALTWETSYGLFVAGVLLAVSAARRHPGPRTWPLWQGVYAALASLPLALWQGGLLTQVAARLLQGSAGRAGAAGLAGFGLRWPPAVVSAHLGALPLASPRASLVALFELGPTLLLTPWITTWSWRRFRAGDWIFGVLTLSAWLAFSLPLVLTYTSETDLPRFSEYALLVWTLCLGLLLLRTPGPGRRLRVAGGLALGLVGFGGLVLAGTSLTAASQTILTYRFDPLDARAGRDLWDRLPEGSLVFDPQGWRATALTGRLTRAVTGDVTFGNPPAPQWRRLRAEPSVQGFLAAGFPFVYLDDEWWRDLPPAAREDLKAPCVTRMSEYRDRSQRHFRWLLDLRGCPARPG